MISDRRSGMERRSSERFAIDVPVEWEASKGRQPGTISDVSLNGCFVLGSGDVTDGEAVKIFVPLADGMKVQFEARIANHVLEIGFGVKFEPLSAAQRDLLSRLVQKAQQP